MAAAHTEKIIEEQEVTDNKDVDVVAELEQPKTGVTGIQGDLGKLDTVSAAADRRVNRRAKRHGRTMQGEFGLLNGQAPNGLHGNHLRLELRSQKNSRRPRNGHGRGLPKKGGGGGKGVWGKPGSELQVQEVDEADPNYDSDSMGSKDVQLEEVVPELTDEEVRKALKPIFLEYFEHGDTEEVAASLEEVNLLSQRHQVVCLSVEFAMDRKPSQREMTSVLLADLFGRTIMRKDFAKGFDKLLSDLPDLTLDTPDAPIILGNFMARAIADDCLPPAFLMGYKGKVDCDHARAALARADTLLSMKHGLVRLDNVWGVGGGLRPVNALVRQMVLLLEEYLSSKDSKEAQRCLRDLEVPHFHHELVYEAVVMAMEKMTEEAEDAMVALLKCFSDAVIITLDQMTNGFLRVYEDMPDICLDVPAAYYMLEKVVNKCQAAGFLSNDVISKLPSRGRKRFVSEGDGGRLKDASYVSPYV
ncbi:unnamed protein product [Darwinula stevensoni]|uniref:Programmed cell death protein 4 n=1 Tax=Darwinula stevensoni TaxID=69355 RepID=A0A7R9FPI1_9CRUS|nr:unnamed protein product [Darwinula stevensoni]CAG0897625.1 unnamed protein product [Darwinula stevensoni]